MNRITGIFVKLIDCLTILFLLPLFVLSLFSAKGVDFSSYSETVIEAGKTPFLTLFLTFVIIFLFSAVLVFFHSKDDKKNWITAYIVTGLSVLIALALGLVWVSHNPFYAEGDQLRVWTAATALCRMNDTAVELEYFNMNPHQKSMAVLMSFVVRLFGGNTIYFEYVNILSVAITVLVLILCVEKVTKRPEPTVITAILLALFIPLFLYSSFIYGTLVSIALSSLSAYGLISFFTDKKRAWLLLPVICIPLSTMMYRGAMIFLIAVVLTLVVMLLVHHAGIGRKMVITGVVSVLMIILLTFAITHLAEGYFDKTLGRAEGGNGIPATAYIMMGLQDSPNFTPGAHTQKHQQIYFENSMDTHLSDLAAREEIRSIADDFISGARPLSFFKEKTEYQWLDPWFGGLTMTVYGTESGDPGFDEFISGDILPGCEKYLRVLMIMVYLGAISCLVIRLFRGNDNVLACFPNICFIGGFIFQFFWEQKSRYCLPFYLTLFPLAAAGIAGVFSRCSEVKPGRENRHQIALWQRVYIFISILIFTVILGRFFLDDRFDYSPDPTYSDTEDCYVTDKIALYPGDYHVTLEYEAGTDTPISLFRDYSEEGETATLEAGSNEFGFEMHLDNYNDVIRFKYPSDVSGGFTLNNIHIESGRFLFTDHILEAILFLFAAVYLLLLLSSSWFVNKTRAEKTRLALIHLTVLFVSLPLLSGTLFWGADAPPHVMRLDGVRDGLLGGQMPVFILPNVDNGYGLLGWMYPNLFLYIPAVLRIFRVSTPLTMNLLYTGINIVTAITAYFSAREFFKRDDQVFLFTMIYLMLPYRLVNIYTRADLGEALAMCFVPLVFAGIFMCVSEEENKKSAFRAVCFLTVGMTGIIHSHVLSSAMMVVFCAAYAVIFIKYIVNRRSLMIIAGSVTMTLLINIGYIIPFFKMYMFGLNISHVTDDFLFTGKYKLWELLGIHDFSSGTAWGGIAVIGDIGIALLIAGVVECIRHERNRTDFFMIVSGFLSVLLMIITIAEFPWNSLANIGIVRSIGSVLEHSFRVMLVASPLLALVTVHFAYKINFEERKRTIAAIVLAIIAFVCILPGMIGEIKAEPYMNRLTGGASRVMLREYLPAGVEDGVFNETRLYWSSEDLTFDQYVKSGINVDFNYTTTSDTNEWIEPPILYYPGYRAKAVTMDGREYQLGVSQGNEYRIRVDLPAPLSGSHVRIYYGGIWYFYIGYSISTLSVIVLLYMIIGKACFVWDSRKGVKR